jgi:tRNA G18 (ribose-2'-O)-methylase SpoU
MPGTSGRGFDGASFRSFGREAFVPALRPPIESRRNLSDHDRPAQRCEVTHIRSCRTVGPVNSTIPIDDPQDPRVADYRHLNDQAVRRRMEGDEFFMSEGWMSIDRLLDSGHRFRSALLSPSRADRFEPYRSRPELTDVPVYVADGAVMDRIVGFHLPRGVLVAAERRPLETVSDLARTSRRLVVLEGINDDENVGAIARAARAFDVDGMVLSPTCTDPYHRRTVRVSMGEILHMRVARAARDAWPGALDTLHGAGFETWALSPGSVDDLWRTPVPDRLALVVGAEGPGLAAPTMALASRRIRIPISDAVDSLNVGHAAAIAFAATAR